MEINTKTFHIFSAVAGGILIWIALLFAALPFEKGSYAVRYIEAFGGSGNGYIQAICYGLAIFAWLELRGKRRHLQGEYGAFELHLLPEQDHLVLSPEEVAEVKLSMLDLEKKGIRFLLSGLIVKVCNQFRNNSSMGEAYTVLSSQIKTSKEALEGELAMTRYVMEAIPMLGFIGTVIGLIDAILESKGMLSINPADKEATLFLVTDAFGMAFGTTLVALLLSLVLSRFYQAYLGKLDIFFSKTENYIVENLVSRVYEGR